MNTKYWLLGIILGLTTLVSSCYYDNKEDLYDYIIVEGEGHPCDFTDVSYTTDIATILNLQCNGACHNASDRQGNVILDTYNRVMPYVNNGSLIGSINHSGGYAIMPPGGQKISSCDIEKIQFWIDNGAPNN